jgi:hypothetical protein
MARVHGKQLVNPISLSGSFSGSFEGAFNGSGTIESASFAVTASHALFAVSASHEITFEVSSSHAQTADQAGNLFGTPSIVVNHITASGNISASGDIFANDITLNALGVSDKPNVILKRGSVTGAELKMGSGGNDAGILRLNNTAGGQDILLQAQGISYFSQSLKIGVAYDYPENNPATLTVGGNISSSGAFHTLSHITASGNINASGHLEGGGLKIDGAEIFAGPNILKLQSGSDVTNTVTVLRSSNDRLVINGGGDFNTIEALNADLIAVDIKATGLISASGNVFGNNIYAGVTGRIYPSSAQTSNNQFFSADANGINSNSSFAVTGNVTASGNISASGDIVGATFGNSSGNIVFAGNVSGSGANSSYFGDEYNAHGGDANSGFTLLSLGSKPSIFANGASLQIGNATNSTQTGIHLVGNVTASIISASGHLAVNDVHANNFRLMTPADAAGSFPMIKTTGNHQASTAKIFIGDMDEFDTNSHLIIDPPNESATFLELNTTISGSLLVRENATLQGGRPITTHTTSPISSSLTNAGRYHVVGGNLTCSIVQSTAVIGAEYEFFQTSSAGNFLFESASGITVISKNGSMRLAQQGSAAVLKKVNSTIYHLMGDLT